MNADMTTRPMSWWRLALAVGVVSAVVALVALWPAQPAYAEDWADSIDCRSVDVEEGDQYRVKVNNENGNNAGNYNLKVYWHTDPGTADASDYVHQEGTRQISNGYQRRQGNMGRNFPTIEDLYPELDETFTIRFENHVHGNPDNDGHLWGHGGNDVDSDRCTVTIQDDDIGIYDLEITSAPADGYAYRVGEQILILARFNDPVAVYQPVLLPLRMGSGSGWWRGAALSHGIGAHDKNWLFVYDVQPGDMDHNGVGVEGSYESGGTVHGLGGSGYINSTTSGQRMSPWFHGLADDPAHRVIGGPSATSVEIVSSPAGRGSYLPGENIEIAMTFDEAVEVEGDRFVGLRVGTGDWWRGARYNRGSGTDTLVFRYTVQDRDVDGDGVSMDGGFTDASGTIHGFGGGGAITSVANGGAANPHYPRLSHQSAHKVGIPYVEDARMTSSPAIGDTYGRGETIQVTVDFSRPVEMQGATGSVLLSLNILGRPSETLEEAFLKALRYGTYVSGSGTETLVFEYTVQQQDRGEDAVIIGAGGILFLKPYGMVGSIVAAGTDADADLAWPVATAPGHLVDGSLGARVASVEITSDPGSDNTYGVGDTIHVTAYFSAGVTISGGPQMTLDFDGTAKTFHRSGSREKLVHFSYEVQLGDMDRNGIAIGANALNLNGGAIQDASGAAAGLLHAAVPSDPGHKVYGAGGL